MKEKNTSPITCKPITCKRRTYLASLTCKFFTIYYTYPLIVRTRKQIQFLPNTIKKNTKF